MRSPADPRELGVDRLEPRLDRGRSFAVAGRLLAHDVADQRHPRVGAHAAQVVQVELDTATLALMYCHATTRTVSTLERVCRLARNWIGPT